MKKIAISYFYQIRNFKPYMIPVSTACFDPKWYHDFKGPNYTFLDKRGIVNGLRCEELHPDDSCKGLCCGDPNCKEKKKNQCPFLLQYRKQLEKININLFLERAEKSLQVLKEQLHLTTEPLLVLIVYETPSNPCSERQVLIDYFNSKGIDCQELKYPI